MKARKKAGTEGSSRIPWHLARRVSAREHRLYKAAAERKLGAKLPRGGGKAEPSRQVVSLRLDRKIIAWAKKEARRRHVPYQTIINESLLRLTA